MRAALDCGQTGRTGTGMPQVQRESDLHMAQNPDDATDGVGVDVYVHVEMDEHGNIIELRDLKKNPYPPLTTEEKEKWKGWKWNGKPVFPEIE
jgi:hypothetical protein